MINELRGGAQPSVCLWLRGMRYRGNLPNSSGCGCTCQTHTLHTPLEVGGLQSYILRSCRHTQNRWFYTTKMEYKMQYVYSWRWLVVLCQQCYLAQSWNCNSLSRVCLCDLICSLVHFECDMPKLSFTHALHFAIIKHYFQFYFCIETSGICCCPI